MVRAVRIKVHGRVQGVNLRVMVKNYCDKNEIDGYVVNLEEGGVVIVVQCKATVWRGLVKWLKSSPGFSRVERVEKRDVEVREKFDDFRIRYEKDFVADQVQSFRNLGRKVLKG